MVEKKRVIHQLEEVLELDEGTLSGHELLKNIENWDSLNILGFIAMVDENYSISINPEELEKCESVDELISLIEKKLS
ncbi:MAG: acyl carrier protein [SAR324 cluster bacterium]|nr:acyl carrier protein [SAR324 cluster bacterium]